jgi:hypothetical protein
MQYIVHYWTSVLSNYTGQLGPHSTRPTRFGITLDLLSVSYLFEFLAGVHRGPVIKSKPLTYGGDVGVKFHYDMLGWTLTAEKSDFFER